MGWEDTAIRVGCHHVLECQLGGNISVWPPHWCPVFEVRVAAEGLLADALSSTADAATMPKRN